MPWGGSSRPVKIVDRPGCPILDPPLQRHVPKTCYEFRRQINIFLARANVVPASLTDFDTTVSVTAAQRDFDLALPANHESSLLSEPAVEYH